MNKLRDTYKKRINIAKDALKYFKRYDNKVFSKDLLQIYLAEKEKISPSPSLEKELEVVAEIKSDIAFMNRASIDGELIKQEEPEFIKRDFSQELDYLIKYAKSSYRLTFNIVETPVQKIMDRKILPPVIYTSMEWIITSVPAKEPPKKVEPRYMNLYCPYGSAKKVTSLEELQNLLEKGNKRGEYSDERARIVENLTDAENDLECEKYHYATSENIFTILKNSVQKYSSALSQYDNKFGPFNTNLEAFQHLAKEECIPEEFIQYIAWFASSYEKEIRETEWYKTTFSDEYRKIQNLIETVSGK